MKDLRISLAVIGGTILGPIIYLYSSEWSILFTGIIAGSIAFKLEKKWINDLILFNNCNFTSNFYFKISRSFNFRKSKYPIKNFPVV